MYAFIHEYNVDVLYNVLTCMYLSIYIYISCAYAYECKCIDMYTISMSMSMSICMGVYMCIS